MKTAAIICEYNPFHNGHKHQIDVTRERFGADCIISFLSGHFVQRGEPALCDKWLRTRLALLGGADLVIEVPSPFSMQSAEGFARAGVFLASMCGVADILSFGSENGDIEALTRCAHLVTSPRVLGTARALMKKGGIPFAAAREEAVRAIDPLCADILKRPNNILAVEYIKAIGYYGSSLSPVTVARHMAGHDEDKSAGAFASATLIRSLIIGGELQKVRPFMPAAVFDAMKAAFEYGPGPISSHSLEQAVLYALRTAQKERIAALPDVGEGLENKIVRCAGAPTLDQYYAALKSRRYPLSRLRRITMHALLDLDPTVWAAPPPYLRVLGFNERGRELLRRMKEKSRLPIIVKPAHIRRAGEQALKVFEAEARAGAILNLGYPREKRGDLPLDYSEGPVIL